MDKKFDVCLVMPPIVNIRYSSLALSLLKTCLINAGISCTIDYASMRFVRLFGLYNHSPFQAKRTIYFHYMPEVIFSEFAGIKPRKDIDELIKIIFESLKTLPEHLKSYEALKNFLDELRIAAEKTIDEAVEKILSFDSKIVGLTSSFKQECASLAIMKKVKEINPSVTTIIGGANCMGTAGTAALKKFKFLDYVFLGEADEVFADICRHILDGEKDFRMPYGLLRQGGEIPEKIPHRITMNMNKVPAPEADDFFAALKENFTDDEIKDDEIKKISPVIMTEGSRGCWWGEKHSCTFCGLNGLVKTYRQKIPQRIADELNYITERYGNYQIWFADCILSRPAGKELPKLLSGRKEKMKMYVEVKSNMTEDELKNLADAGFYQFQPGIESLSDVVLKLMNKGNTAINHIALLKYAQKHSVILIWNFMYGFLGEDFETYEELCELMPLIYHLPAPSGGVPVAYHRNSVYCDNPEKYSLKLTPSTIYDYFAPDDQDFINDYAYFFVDHSENEEKRKHPVYKKFNDSISHWIDVYYNGNARLDMIVFEDRIKIFDTREIRVKSRYELTELSREIYLLCSSPKSYKTILETFTENYGQDEVDSCLTELENLKLLLRIRDEFLSLAVERPQESLFSLLFMNTG